MPRRIKRYAEGGAAFPGSDFDWTKYGSGPEFEFFKDRKIPGIGPLVPTPTPTVPQGNSGGGSGSLVPLLGLGLVAGRDLWNAYRDGSLFGDGMAGINPELDTSGWDQDSLSWLENYGQNMPMPGINPEDVEGYTPSWWDQAQSGIQGGINDTNDWISQDLDEWGSNMEMPTLDPTWWDYIEGAGNIGMGGLGIYAGSQAGGLGGAGAALGGAGTIADTLGYNNAGGALGGLGDIAAGINRGDAQGYLQAGSGVADTLNSLGYGNAITNAYGDYVPYVGAALNLGDAFEGGIDSGAEAGAATNAAASLMAAAAGAGPAGALFALGAAGIGALSDQYGDSTYQHRGAVDRTGAAVANSSVQTDYGMMNIPWSEPTVKSDGTKVYTREVPYEGGSVNRPERRTYTQTVEVPPMQNDVAGRLQGMGLNPADYNEMQLRQLDHALSLGGDQWDATLESFKPVDTSVLDGWMENLPPDWADSIIGFADGGPVQEEQRMIPRGALSRMAAPPQTSPGTPSYYTYGAQPAPQMPPQQPRMPGRVMQMPQVRRAMGGSTHMSYNRGGDPNLVRGPGSGRSDDIPARLSDGEYIWDAETVALLGDGSTDEGARKLDALRKKLRMDKGKNLAKGKFSTKAKAPEDYLE